MADLSETLDKVHQLGDKNTKVEALLDATKQQLAQLVQQMKALTSAGGSTEAAQLKALADSLDKTLEGVDAALTAHRSESGDTDMPKQTDPNNIHSTTPAPTGNPSNPIQNPAPENPAHTDIDPDPGETGDNANPIQNPAAPNPVDHP